LPDSYFRRCRISFTRPTSVCMRPRRTEGIASNSFPQRPRRLLRVGASPSTNVRPRTGRTHRWKSGNDFSCVFLRRARPARPRPNVVATPARSKRRRTRRPALGERRSAFRRSKDTPASAPLGNATRMAHSATYGDDRCPAVPYDAHQTCSLARVDSPAGEHGTVQGLGSDCPRLPQLLVRQPQVN